MRPKTKAELYEELIIYSLQRAEELLEMLSKEYPPPKGHKWAVSEDKKTVIQVKK